MSSLASGATSTTDSQSSASATSAADTQATSTRSTSNPGYRRDIDGLRAIAVLLVVVYHVWLGRVSGGVDAFLIISAFLLTGSLMRRLESTGKVRAFSQWVRNFKRMMPAAAVVIIATIAAGALVLPESTRTALLKHASASILYVENWLLASESVDYYANTAFANPLQHFWSLSVQGQVFLLWPVLFVIIALVSKLIGRKRARAIALVLFGAVFAVSLTYSVITTQTQQEFAYFNTGARLWEFAAGSILALVAPWIKLPTVLRAVFGWLGIAALLTCGIVLDVNGGFPGYYALWPVLAVCAVIIAGNDPDRRFGPARLLETKPVQFLGRSSYALYLVHWPMLVLTLVWLEVEQLNGMQGLALIVIAIALAWLLTVAVDAPLRKNAWLNGANWHGLIAIVLCLLVVLGPAITLLKAAERKAAAELAAVEAAPAQVLEQRYPGAAVLASDWNGAVDLDAPSRPLATEVDSQWASLANDCTDNSITKLPASIEICFDNDMPDAEHTIMVIGNSHSQQMLPAISRAASAEGWQVISLLYGACAFGLREVDEDRGIFYSQQCRDWNEDALDLVEKIKPGAVITIGTETIPAEITRVRGKAASSTAQGEAAQGDAAQAQKTADAKESADTKETTDAEASADAAARAAGDEEERGSTDTASSSSNSSGSAAGSTSTAGEKQSTEKPSTDPKMALSLRNSITGTNATEEHVLEGVEESIKRLEKLDIPIVLIRDNPRFTESAYQCAEQFAELDARTGTDSVCVVDRDATYTAQNPADALKSDTTAVIDLSDAFCVADVCPAIIGNTFVYIDDNHLSRVYSETLGTLLGEQLVAAFTDFGIIDAEDRAAVDAQ